jgi:hypothetical protein
VRLIKRNLGLEKMEIASAAQSIARLRRRDCFLQADSRMTRSKKRLNLGLIAIYHFFIAMLSGGLPAAEPYL